MAQGVDLFGRNESTTSHTKPWLLHPESTDLNVNDASQLRSTRMGNLRRRTLMPHTIEPFSIPPLTEPS